MLPNPLCILLLFSLLLVVALRGGVFLAELLVAGLSDLLINLVLLLKAFISDIVFLVSFLVLNEPLFASFFTVCIIKRC